MKELVDTIIEFRERYKSKFICKIVIKQEDPNRTSLDTNIKNKEINRSIFYEYKRFLDNRGIKIGDDSDDDKLDIDDISNTTNNSSKLKTEIESCNNSINNYKIDKNKLDETNNKQNKIYLSNLLNNNRKKSISNKSKKSKKQNNNTTIIKSNNIINDKNIDLFKELNKIKKQTFKTNSKIIKKCDKNNVYYD
jgi:hypothetical protein